MENNNLKSQSASLISELTTKCKVKVLWITGNHSIGEDHQLYSMFTNPSNILEQLYMRFTSLSGRSAIDLFTALKNNNKLKQLYIEINNITDDACNAIIAALEMNRCLTELCMYRNPLSIKAIVNIVRCLVVNDTLKLLVLPKCPQEVHKDIFTLQEVVNKKRESQGCQVKLEIKIWHTACQPFYC